MLTNRPARRRCRIHYRFDTQPTWVVSASSHVYGLTGWIPAVGETGRASINAWVSTRNHEPAQDGGTVSRRRGPGSGEFRRVRQPAKGRERTGFPDSRTSAGQLRD